MNFEPTPCDFRRVDRLRDGALDENERRQVQAHVDNCPHCRRHFHQTDRIGKAVDRRLREMELDEGEAARLAAATVRRLRRQPSSFLQSLADRFTLKRMWFPAAASAFAMMAAIFALQWQNGQEPSAPSAIVRSFRSDTASVMIMETRNERQTVIWLSEES